MALSKPVVPESLQEMPDIGQHYVECATEDCDKNCQFYCNPCHRPLCEKCREEHLKNPDKKNHEVVLYQQRMRQLPVQMCTDHPTKDIDMLCEECQVPVCSKCATANHQGHIFIDLEKIYSERCTHCLEEIHKIHRHYLPTSESLQREIREDETEIKSILEKIRISMKAEAETLKSLVDEEASKNLEKVNKIEKSLMETLQTQYTTYNEYISYLNDLVKEFHGYLSSTESLKIISVKENKLKIQSIPDSTKPVPPVYTTGRISKDDVAKLLGRVNIPTAKPEKRNIEPRDTDSEALKATEETKQVKEKYENNDTLSLSSSVTEVRQFIVPGVSNVFHISLCNSGSVWASNNAGSLIQTNQHGNLLQIMKTTGEAEGYHAVTQDRDLIYADKRKKVINRITTDNAITKFTNTGDWEPLSIHSSRINGDILVGMTKYGEAKITRYNKTGTEIQNIQTDNTRRKLYDFPYYITENINGDICKSDYDKVVVVNKSGQYRFSYTGRKRAFRPHGLCTDVLCQILVCEYFSDTVHLLNKDGQFLCFILTREQGMHNPRSVCVDDENNLYVGRGSHNIVKVYKYLQ